LGRHLFLFGFLFLGGFFLACCPSGYLLLRGFLLLRCFLLLLFLSALLALFLRCHSDLLVEVAHVSQALASPAIQPRAGTVPACGLNLSNFQISRHSSPAPDTAHPDRAGCRLPK